MTAASGDLADILARLGAMEQDMRDLTDDIGAAVGTPKAERMCAHAQAAISHVRALVAVERELLPGGA